MRRYFLFAVGLAIIGLLTLTQETKAYVYTEFAGIDLVRASYEELGNTKIELDQGDFGLPPNFNVEDLRNGYHNKPIPLGFTFKYNSEEYEEIWVNINGFACFVPKGQTPPYVAPDVNDGLFIKSTSYPNNVLAPFWGDHHYRNADHAQQGFMRTSISYQTIDDGTNTIFILEWKDLNINFQSYDDEGNPIEVKSSVADFQIRIYKSNDPLSTQGDIEFCYGQIGGNLDPSAGNTVITRGCAVGVKGESGDYMNALRAEDLMDVIRTDDSTKTIEWTPSGATDLRFRFMANVTYEIDEWWGDGDADMSKAVGKLHHNMGQDRFVTFNDVRTIMKAEVTGVPLDSIRRREAYHADVNHNGRFYYTIDGVRTEIKWRSYYYTEDLPEGISTPKSILFQTSEYDAAMILDYLSGRIPLDPLTNRSLPYIYDWHPQYGKLAADESVKGINFGVAQKISENTYRLPVFVNNNVNGYLSGRFDLDAEIVSVSSDLMIENGTSSVVFAGSGEFTQDAPFAFITVTTENNEVNASNIRINDENRANFATNIENSNANSLNIKNIPNPFTEQTVIDINVDNGNYNIAIYDIFGNIVYDHGNVDINSNYNFTWKGVDNNNQQVANGVYIVKVISGDVQIANNIILNR